MPHSLLTGFKLIVLLFNTEDGGSTFLQNIGELIPNNKAPHPKDSAPNSYCHEII
jgi:hypothetical protein